MHYGVGIVTVREYFVELHDCTDRDIREIETIIRSEGKFEKCFIDRNRIHAVIPSKLLTTDLIGYAQENLFNAVEFFINNNLKEIKENILDQQIEILIEKIKQRDETIANLNDLIRCLRKPI